MRGKEKCHILQEIRKRIADENDIPYEIIDCNHQGDCSGTCPKCERELQWLTEQLQKGENPGIPVKRDAPGSAGYDVLGMPDPWERDLFRHDEVQEDGSGSEFLMGEVKPGWESEAERRAEMDRIRSFLEKMASAMFRSEDGSADQPNASGHDSLHTAATPNSSADGQIF